jgi:branched-chain amino acid aminotransferase
MRTIYFDGRYIKVNVQIIEAFTPGVFKAKGVFETMLGLDGVVLDTALHMKRLREGLKTLSITPPRIDRSIFKELVCRNKLSWARVRMMVWQAGRQTHLMMVALPYKTRDKQSYRVCLLKTDRAANAHWANVKSLDYELFAQAYVKAQRGGFDEALLINRNGFIFEASRANIFWVKDRTLYTPPLSSGCLNGITRRQVIKQAVHLKISVKEKELTPAMLKAADAAFLTNSLIGIKPIAVASIAKGGSFNFL